MWKDLSISAIAAGFIAVLVSYSGPLAILFQAGEAGHIAPDMVSSWILGISLGAGISGVLLSIYLRAPIVTAWSAPGTALLVTLLPSMSMNEVVGAYLIAAAIIFAIGITGTFDRIIALIPPEIAAGMMAGILFPFGIGAFKSITSLPVLALGMTLAFLIFRRLAPRYSVVLVLVSGIALAVGLGTTHLQDVRPALATPQLVVPAFGFAGLMSLALPLVLVSLTGQFMPGMAILRSAGYPATAKPIIAVTSIVSLFMAVLGGITIVIAAITAAICTGPAAHPDPAKRYIAGVANGVFYLIGGLFSGTIVMLYSALPKEFVAVTAGLALIGAITVNLMGAVKDEKHRDAAMITFLATASGLTFLGLGSAFWGVVIGVIAHLIENIGRPAAKPAS